MDWDLALRTEEPPTPIDDSTSSQKFKYEKWHKSNRIALLIIKMSMKNVLRGGFPDATNAKDFLKFIEAKYRESPKNETGNLMNALTTMRYDGVQSVREYILKMMDVARKLNALEVPISDTFLVHVIMNSLHENYTQLKVYYNGLREKWDVNELIAICASEEERMKKEKFEKERYEPMNFVQSATRATKPHVPDVAKKDSTKSAPSPKRNFKLNKPSVFKCYFCKKAGHMKKNCPKYKVWLAKQEAKKGLHNKENTK
ncbi:uncharacterized protein [Malus domestica]|uniref:uncharacterized protein n=1 Tax=Malus domestica TaxID=3750 RepID=UPI003974FBAE